MVVQVETYHGIMNRHRIRFSVDTLLLGDYVSLLMGDLSKEGCDDFATEVGDEAHRQSKIRDRRFRSKAPNMPSALDQLQSLTSDAIPRCSVPYTFYRKLCKFVVDSKRCLIEDDE